MKKDRCNMNMPMYPGYMPNMMNGVNPNMFYNPLDDYNSQDQQISNLNNRISSLERRISNLEGLIGNNNTTYNTTNYQML